MSARPLKNPNRWINLIFPRVVKTFSLACLTMLGTIWLLIILYVGFELVLILSNSTPDQFARVRAVLITIMAVIGVPFLIWRTRIADRQNKLNRENRYTDLFVKSVELLGSTYPSETGAPAPSVETRVGAIFALERLAKESQRDYGIIVETLSAYIREQCGRPSEFRYEGDDPDDDGISPKEKLRRLKLWATALGEWLRKLPMPPPASRADVTAALTVLSRRNEGRIWSGPTGEAIQPNLARTNLQGARLSSMTKGLAEEDIGLSSAYLEGAQLEGFEIEGSSLLKPNITHHRGQYVLMPNQLVGIVSLGFTLRNAQIVPIFDGADLSFAHIDGARFEQARFRAARLVRSNVEHASIPSGKFGIADLSEAKFDGANLKNAEFVGANLNETSFVGADLRHAEFHGAMLRDTKFEGALLSGADLTETRGMEQDSIAAAFGTADTILPNGVVRPGEWQDEKSAVRRWRAFRKARGWPNSAVDN